MQSLFMITPVSVSQGKLVCGTINRTMGFHLTDALVAMTHMMLTVTEANTTVDVCVDPGISGNISLFIVSLEVNNGKVSECH